MSIAFKNAEQSFWAYIYDVDGYAIWSEEFTLLVCNTQPSFENEVSLVYEINAEGAQFSFSSFTSELEGCLDGYSYTTTLAHAIIFEDPDYFVEFDTSSLFTESFQIIGTNMYGEKTFSPTIKVEVRDSNRPVFSFPIFLEPLEVSIE